MSLQGQHTQIKQ